MLMITIMVENMVTTHTSDNKGEKYLKENADWLGYNESHITEASSKKFDDMKDLRDDARSNGIRVDTPINYGMNSGVTIQSMQDDFEPG